MADSEKVTKKKQTKEKEEEEELDEPQFEEDEEDEEIDELECVPSSFQGLLSTLRPVPKRNFYELFMIS